MEIPLRSLSPCLVPSSLACRSAILRFPLTAASSPSCRPANGTWLFILFPAELIEVRIILWHRGALSFRAVAQAFRPEESAFRKTSRKNRFPLPPPPSSGTHRHFSTSSLVYKT